jgi:trehalose/maltose hydrolase-like predicted phosphorylase
MAAVLGFAGLQFDGAAARLNPALPRAWKSVELPVVLRGSSFRLQISRDAITVTAETGNREAVAFAGFGGEAELCRPGAQLRLGMADKKQAAAAVENAESIQ